MVKLKPKIQADSSVCMVEKASAISLYTILMGRDSGLAKGDTHTYPIVQACSRHSHQAHIW